MKIVCVNCNEVISTEPDIKGYHSIEYDICNECYQEGENTDDDNNSDPGKNDNG